MKNAAKLLKNNLPKLHVAFGKATQQEVLAGVPREEADRSDDNEGMNNATIAYVQDQGSPAANIPARPFMEPGIRNAKDKLVQLFKASAKTVLVGDDSKIQGYFHKIGMTAQSSIRMVINQGPPPPLAESTLAMRRRKGRKSTKPLVDTGQLRNSINYVVRKK